MTGLEWTKSKISCDHPVEARGRCSEDVTLLRRDFARGCCVRTHEMGVRKQGEDATNQIRKASITDFKVRD